MSEKKTSIDAAIARTRMVGMGTAGAAYAIDPTLGGLIANAIEPAAQVVGWLTGRRGQRALESAATIKERAEAEGLDTDSEHLGNLVEEALPLLGKTVPGYKRQMMEEILINGARRAQDFAGQVDAKNALEHIDHMPDEAALVFAAFIAQMKERGPGWDIPNVPKLSNVSQKKAERFLKEVYLQDRRAAGFYGGALIVEKRNDNGFDYSEEGRWLADWITNNPSPKPPTEEAMEPA